MDNTVYTPSLFSDLLYNRRRSGMVEVGEMKIAQHVAEAAHPNKTNPMGQIVPSHVSAIWSGTKKWTQQVFSRLYENNQGKKEADTTPLPDNKYFGWMPEAHDALSESEEFRRLQDAVCGDPDMSALATSSLTSFVADVLKKQKEDEDQGEPSENDSGGSSGGSGSGSGKGTTRGNGKPQRGMRQIGTATERLQRQIAKLVKKAHDNVSEAKSNLNGLLPGSGDAPPVADHEDTSRYDIAQQLKQYPAMRKVAKLVGRLKRVSDRKMRRKRSHGATCIHSVTLGKDIPRILPSELARLGHDSLKAHAIVDLFEGKMLQYKLQGDEPQGKGPMYILLDISGSMSGDPNAMARAIGIFFSSLALEEGREVVVLDFNGRVQRHTHRKITKDGRATIGYDNPKTVTPIAAIGHIAIQGTSGGTSFDNALKFVITDGNKNDKADIVFVTDGYDVVDQTTKDDINKWKDEKGLKIFGMLINGGQLHNSVDFCDKIIDLDTSNSLETDVVALALGDGGSR